MLTPEQIKQIRLKSGLPEQGLAPEISADQRIAELRGSQDISTPTESPFFESKGSIIPRATLKGTESSPEAFGKFLTNIPLSTVDVAVAPIENAIKSVGELKGVFTDAPSGKEAIKSILGGFADTLKKATIGTGESIYDYLEKKATETTPEGQLKSPLQVGKEIVGDTGIGLSKSVIEDPFWWIVGTPESKLVSKTAGVLETGVKTATKTGQELLQTGIEKGKGLIASGVEKGKNIIPENIPMSESIISNINRIDPSKRKLFEAQQGVSEEQWLRERGMIGTRDETVKMLVDNYTTLNNNLDSALEKIPGTYRDPRITKVAEESADIAKSIESPEMVRLEELAEKSKGVGLSAKETIDIKRFYERNVKVAYKKDLTKTSEQVQRATNRDSGIREALIEIADKNGFTNLRQVSKEIQANRFLADEIAGKMIGQGANNAMTLTDWIAITPGIIDPKFLAGFATKKLFSTETVRAYAAKALAGFPKQKPLMEIDVAEITKKANEYAKKMNLNKAEQEEVVNFILQQRAEGKAVGETFIMKDVDNTPILNPQERFQSLNKPQTAQNIQNDIKTTISPNTSTKSPLTQSISKGQQKVTDIKQFKRAENLSPEKRQIENKAFDYILKNEASILAAYNKLKKTGNGKIVNADDFRPLLKEAGYTDGSLSAAVQEPVSYLAKRARVEGLKNPGKYVVATAGGSGAGKTAAAKVIPEITNLQKNAAMVLDSNFSSMDSALKFIDEVKNSGKDFVGVFTYRDFMDALENGIVKRMLKNPDEMGRIVPNKITSQNHIGSWDVVQKLVDDGYEFYFVDNSLGAGKAKLVSLAELKSKIKYPSKERLKELADNKIRELQRNGVIKDAKQVEGYIE